MEDVRYQPEFLAMQGNSYERLKEPRDGTLPTSTVLLSAVPSAPPPRDHVIWSLFNLIYMNTFCLGFAAFYFSIKSRDRKVAGDLEGAREYGSTARCLNCFALWLTLFFVLLVLTLVFVGVLNIYSVAAHQNQNYGG